MSRGRHPGTEHLGKEVATGYAARTSPIRSWYRPATSDHAPTRQLASRSRSWSGIVLIGRVLSDRIDRGPCAVDLLHVPMGFANLVVEKQDNKIILDPRVTGECVIILHELEAQVLRDALIDWLG